MEARSFFENSSMREITVSASPEEWRQVIEGLNLPSREDASAELIYRLIDQGVYDR